MWRCDEKALKTFENIWKPSSRPLSIDFYSKIFTSFNTMMVAAVAGGCFNNDRAPEEIINSFITSYIC